VRATGPRHENCRVVSTIFCTCLGDGIGLMDLRLIEWSHVYVSLPNRRCNAVVRPPRSPKPKHTLFVQDQTTGGFCRGC
jgi:hypothetical protein